MNKENPVKNLPATNVNELLKRKKKVISHLVNLECKKEQLSILIERLSNISSERKDFISAEQGQSIISKLFSMGSQLTQAEKDKNRLEKEISQAKEQMESINSIISERELSDKG